METINPAALRAEMQAKKNYADFLADRARAKLGLPVETRPARSARGRTATRVVNLRTLSVQDARSVKKLMKAWTKSRIRCGRGAKSSVTLASGRTLWFNHDEMRFEE